MPRLTLTLAALALLAPIAAAADPAADAAATRAEIAATLGGVPTFVGQVADAALPGLWTATKTIEFGTDTALDPKTKSLISLAVAASIPCQYCVFADTKAAKERGATDQEIAEAVAVAGLTRNWSVQFYGLQVDMQTFRAELSQ